MAKEINNTRTSTATTGAEREKVSFLSVSDFKEKIGATHLSVLRNPNTGKLFMATEKGQNFKVQQEIDTDSEMRVLIPQDGDLENACLTNVNTDNMAEVLATL